MKNNKKLIQTALVAIIGNALEIYDFALYGIFAPVLGNLFFPLDNSHISFLAALSVYAVGFFMRPLGGIIFGHFGDLWGRRKALSISIIMTALPTFIISILPTYDQIGVTAPIILISCRLIQGLGVGGEYNGASIFLIEHFHKEKLQGTAGALISSSGGFGALLAIFMYYFSLQIPYAWGWRIPFMLGACLGLIGFYMRSHIAESPQYCHHTLESSLKFPLLKAITKHPISILRTIGVGALQGSLVFTIFVYMNLYLSKHLKMPFLETMFFNSLSLIVFIFSVPLSGFLSDKIGVIKTIRIGALIIILVMYPIFSLLSSENIVFFTLAHFLFGLCISIFIGPANVFMNRLFPINVRYSGVAFGYCIGVSLVGGTLPLISEYLIQKTGNIMIPAFYLTLTGLIGFIAVFGSRITLSLHAMESTNVPPPSKDVASKSQYA